MQTNFFYNADTSEFYVLRTVFAVTAIIVLIIALTLGVKMLFFPAAIVGRVMNADNVLYNYEWFFNKYQSIQAAERNVKESIDSYDRWRKSVPANPEKWSYSAHEENGRLNTNISGIQMHWNELVADYNAKSSMVSKNIFKSGKLPARINLQ